MNDAVQRLIELGLGDKEAACYLAMLELGPATAQEIAAKSGVQRTTAYEILDDLAGRRLVSRIEQGRTTQYAAESPDRLRRMLEEEASGIDARRQKLREAMPMFLALYNAVQEKPAVRFFEGEEGITAAREALTPEPEAEYLSFTAIDEGVQRMSEINARQRHTLARRVRGRLLVAIKPGCVMPEMELKSWQVREIPYEQSPFTGEINLVGNNVAAFVVKQNPMGFVVESPEMSRLFRTLFEAAWRGAQEYKQPRP